MNSALLVAVVALFFTLASFWWLNARRGKLQVGRPGAYAFADKPRLRLPLVFYNTGARALIVTDLRVLVDDTAERPLRWIATISQLRPENSNARVFATPFAVPGRGTRELVIEFGHEQGWSPELGSKRLMRLEAKLHDRDDDWRRLAEFDWFAPPPGAEPNRYITYRNAPPEEQPGAATCPQCSGPCHQVPASADVMRQPLAKANDALPFLEKARRRLVF